MKFECMKEIYLEGEYDQVLFIYLFIFFIIPQAIKFIVQGKESYNFYKIIESKFFLHTAVSKVLHKSIWDFLFFSNMKKYKWLHIYATILCRKLTLTATFSSPVGLRGILFELVTLEFVSPTVFNHKAVMSNGIMVLAPKIFFHINFWSVLLEYHVPFNVS